MKELKSDIYSAAELAKIFGNRMAVTRAVQSEIVKRVGHGFYRTPDIAETRAISMIAKKFFHDGIVSNQSILFHYKLDFTPPLKLDLDVVHGTPVRDETSLFAFHKTSKISFVTEDIFNGVKLKCYTPERAVFEAIKIDNGVNEFAKSVALNYVKEFGTKGNRPALEESAAQFGDKGQILLQIILAFAQAEQNKFA